MCETCLWSFGWAFDNYFYLIILSLAVDASPSSIPLPIAHLWFKLSVLAGWASMSGSEGRLATRD